MLRYYLLHELIVQTLNANNINKLLSVKLKNTYFHSVLKAGDQKGNDPLK